MPEYTKVVINGKHGGFGISDKAIEYLRENYGLPEPIEFFINREQFSESDLISIRSSPFLVETVEALGRESWGEFAKLVIVDIPEDIIDRCYIDEHDGYEVIRENHRVFPEYKRRQRKKQADSETKRMGATPSWVDFTP